MVGKLSPRMFAWPGPSRQKRESARFNKLTVGDQVVLPGKIVQSLSQRRDGPDHHVLVKKGKRESKIHESIVLRGNLNHDLVKIGVKEVEISYCGGECLIASHDRSDR